MKLAGYLRVGLNTTLNVILNALTLGRFLWLEGRVTGGVFLNWARGFRYAPRRFARPTAERELVDLVRNSKSVRLFGSGHSFNSGVVSDETLISLDDYSSVVDTDLANKRMTVQAGRRVRDVISALLDRGLAFKALPSHDAQSIAGIISTDVHGTGRDWGFVSQLVERLKVIDGRGDVHECVPSDDLFKAAIGGVGGVGIISEVTVQAVDRFNVEQRVYFSTLREVESNLDHLLATNEHLSLYLFPYTQRCQVNTWNSTREGRSPFGTVHEFLSISADALLAAWFGNFMAYAGLLPRWSDIANAVRRGSNLVLESNRAYNRTIYHLHQELEFTVPFEDTFPVCRRFLKLYEDLYAATTLPYALFEVRFTPAGHDRTLLGAGQERRCTWIDLVLNDSPGFEIYYAAAEELLKEIGARPHLGKFCQTFGPSDMERLYGENFRKYLRLAEEHDPQRKFSNEFTRRLFGR